MVIPKSIKDFVEQQKTIPLKELDDVEAGPQSVPYTEYWRRAVAAMLLSGRVRPNQNRSTNKTDITRICKEANFNQCLFESTAEFLVRAGIVGLGGFGDKFRTGDFWDAFWNRNLAGLRTASQNAFMRYMTQFSATQPKHSGAMTMDRPCDFLSLLIRALDGLALHWPQRDEVLVEFSKLPAPDLIALGREHGMKLSEFDVGRWKCWFETRGTEAFVHAFSSCEWYYVDDSEKPKWLIFSESARIMLGLDEPSKPLQLATEFHALPNLNILAGSDLSPKKLVPLFRFCKIHRIDRVFEFHLDKRRMAEMPSMTSAESELREVLADLDPLPATIERLLRDAPVKKTGKVQMRLCSALLEPENAEVLAAIKENRRLKNYLEPGSPPGYLLVKHGSDPYNFVKRCTELGFSVKRL
ncbi:MAG TPA: hypothetical protein VGH74_01280 [Planctomycetaceae bacterium]|jgi:hypothetical protein